MIHANIYPITDPYRCSYYSTIWKYNPEIVLASLCNKNCFSPAIYFCMEFCPWAWPSNEVIEASRITFKGLAECSLPWVGLKPKICFSHIKCASALLWSTIHTKIRGFFFKSAYPEYHRTAKRIADGLLLLTGSWNMLWTNLFQVLWILQHLHHTRQLISLPCNKRHLWLPKLWGSETGFHLA